MKKIKKIRIIDPGSPPDVDSDIMTEKRDKLINYIINKYGENNVGSIITPGPFRAKNSWKSMCSVYGVPFDLSNKISKLIPDEAKTLKGMLEKDGEYYEIGKEIRNYLEDKEDLKKIFVYASKLDGRMRETGVHACGYIISSNELTENVPVQVRGDGLPIIQYSYTNCESVGLIKMDLLGLDTIDLIYNTLENIKKTEGVTIDLDEIIKGPLNDKKTFKLFQTGKTEAIFQFSGKGVQTMLKKVHPTEFEELAAITAIYRPGPIGLGLHEDFAKRKKDVKARIPVHPNFYGTKLEEILKNTLGALVYQEQVILIAQQCAGFTPKEADSLRKAIGKKKMDLMLSLGDKFKKGMLDNGYGEEEINKLWDGIVGFGAYSFNKSHSVSYALNSYLSAYLKAHYPDEFMATVIKQKEGVKEIMKFISEARSLGCIVETPNINKSNYKTDIFVNNKKKKIIVFGLKGIKGINSEVVKNLVQERETNGEFKDIYNFIERCESFLTPTTIKILAHSGALDDFGTRKGIYDSADTILARVKSKKEMENKIECSLFSLANIKDDAPVFSIPTEEYDFLKKVKTEFSATNMFISSHPIDYIDKEMIDLEDLTTPGKYTFFATFTKIEQKLKKGKRVIHVTVDNKISAKDFTLSHNDTVRIRKQEFLDKVEDFIDEDDKYKQAELLSGYITGKNTPDFKDLKPLPEPIIGNVYKFTVDVIKFNDNSDVYYKILNFDLINLDSKGKIKGIYTVKLKNKNKIKEFEEALKENPGNDDIILKFEDNTEYIVKNVTFYSGGTQNTLERIDIE